MTMSGEAALRPAGSSQLYVIVSDPVSQLQLPAIFNDIFRRAQHDAVLVALQVGTDSLDTVIAGLRAIGNLAGIVIGYPHRHAVLRHADSLGEMARITDAANALRRLPDGRWHADMLDGDGFLWGLRAAGHEVAGRHALLVGAGSAGSAIAATLLEARLAQLDIHDLDPSRSHRLAERLHGRWAGRIAVLDTPEADGADLVINATPLGRHAGDPLPFAPARLTQGTLVADIVIQSGGTPLLREAARRGLPTHRGIYMLSEEIRSYAEFFGFSWALDRIGWSEQEYESP